jgi:hypothetical protein
MYICIAKYVFVRTDIDALPKNDWPAASGTQDT